MSPRETILDFMERFGYSRSEWSLIVDYRPWNAPNVYSARLLVKPVPDRPSYQLLSELLGTAPTGGGKTEEEALGQCFLSCQEALEAGVKQLEAEVQCSNERLNAIRWVLWVLGEDEE